MLKGYVTSKKQKIAVGRMGREKCGDKIISRLKEFEDIKAVTANRASGEVRIEYDLFKIRLGDIEKAVIESGYSLYSKFFAKFKRDWLKDSEKNE